MKIKHFQIAWNGEKILDDETFTSLPRGPLHNFGQIIKVKNVSNCLKRRENLSNEILTFVPPPPPSPRGTPKNIDANDENQKI